MLFIYFEIRTTLNIKMEFWNLSKSIVYNSQTQTGSILLHKMYFDF